MSIRSIYWMFAIALVGGLGCRQAALAGDDGNDLNSNVRQSITPRNGGECESWFDNFSLLLSLDASREPQDLGINAQLGAFMAANIGLPLIEDAGIGLQLGMGANVAKAGVRVLGLAEGTVDRQQLFYTAAIFQRIDDWHWAAGHDFVQTFYYNEFSLGQIRGEVGKQIGDCNEVGFWGTLKTYGEHGQLLGADFDLKPISQLNFYWRHVWESKAETKFWLGLAERHGKDIVIIPDTNLTDVVPVFGLSVFVPLNDHFVLFGEGNFITPNDTGTMDAYLGIAWYPGGGVMWARSNRFAPVLPVANNPTFSTDLRRK